MIHEEDWKIMMETPQESSERYRRYAVSLKRRRRWYNRATPAKRYVIAGVVIVVITAVLGYFLT